MNHALAREGMGERKKGFVARASRKNYGLRLKHLKIGYRRHTDQPLEITVNPELALLE